MAVSIEVAPPVVRVTLSGITPVLSFKRRFEIPLDKIESVATRERGDVPVMERGWLRLGGTHVPGIARFGTYGTKGRKQFWAVGGRPPVLVINVRDWDYQRVVLGVKQPDVVAGAIRAGMA
jgi:hypothetical protein